MYIVPRGSTKGIAVAPALTAAKRGKQRRYSRSQTRLAKNYEGIPHSEPDGQVQWSAVPSAGVTQFSMVVVGQRRAGGGKQGGRLRR